MIASKAKVGSKEVVVGVGTSECNPEQVQRLYTPNAITSWIKYDGTWYKTKGAKSVISILSFLRESLNEEEFVDRVSQLIQS